MANGRVSSFGASGLSIEVRQTVNEVSAEFNDVQRRVVPAAVAAALNKTAAKHRTTAARTIAQVKGIRPLKLVRERLKLVRATSRRQSAYLVVLLAGIPVDKMSGGQKAFIGYRGQFRQNVGKVQKGIWRRKEGASRRTHGRPATSSANLPIERVKVLLLPEARQIVQRLVAQGDAEFSRQFEHEMNYRLQRRGLL